MEDKTGTIERTNGKVTIFAPTGRCEVEIKKQEDIVEKDTICNPDGAGTGTGAGNACTCPQDKETTLSLQGVENGNTV
jgi:hypothetical protein